MNNIDKTYMINFEEKGDDRGNLVIVEGLKDVPFEIKRVFYIYKTSNDVVRGKHANKKTKFVLINLGGRCKVLVKDGKGNEKVYLLDKANMGVYIPTMVWKDMYDFSEDSVLLCLASEHYDSEEYIRDYNEFVSIVNNK